jgi:hypothetical protein
METNPRIERLTRDALGDRKSEEIRWSVASIEPFVLSVVAAVVVVVAYGVAF